ncbi:hypothetical protein [Streptomyces sp. NPDC000134]|uniref:hypothetical protein n=1 Tax=Streptomyces sp. NPDC000134 TaxID=3364536 RepID=UPI0036B1D5F3
MRPLRYVALGDSPTEGVGDPAGGHWRGWAALLATGPGDPGAGPVRSTDLAAGGAQTRDAPGAADPRCADLPPHLLTLTADEVRHRPRGTGARLGLTASAAASAALAPLSAAESPEAA